MSFSGLILREFRWWLRSPALWWALLPAAVLLALSPAILLLVSGYRAAEAEQAWLSLSGYIALVKPFTLHLPGLGPLLAQVEGFLGQSPFELWQRYALPPLQAWGFLPLSLCLPPLAVLLFNRDRDSGVLEAQLAAGAGAFRLLLALLLGALPALLLIQGVSLALFLLLMGPISGHGALFSLTDPLWLVSWLLGGLICACWTLALSWLACLLSRQSAVYHAIFLSSLLSPLPLLALHSLPWSTGNLLVAAFVALPPLIMAIWLLSWRMRAERFLLK